MASHVFLIGSAGAIPRLQCIAGILRKKPGFVVSCYFNRDIEYARTAVHAAHFILLGLSRSSREVSSQEHQREKLLCQCIHDLSEPPDCGILCDEDGYISAHYLAKYGDLVRLVFTDRAGGTEAPLMLFNNFRHIPVARGAADEAGAVAQAVFGHLHPAKAVARA